MDAHPGLGLTGARSVRVTSTSASTTPWRYRCHAATNFSAAREPAALATAAAPVWAAAGPGPVWAAGPERVVVRVSEPVAVSVRAAREPAVLAAAAHRARPAALVAAGWGLGPVAAGAPGPRRRRSRAAGRP